MGKKINLEREEREAEQKRINLEKEVENAKLRLLERKKQAEKERQRIIEEQEEIRQMLEKLSSDAILEEEQILNQKNEFEGEGFELEKRMTELKVDENLVKLGLEIEKEKLDKNRQDETQLKLVEE